MDINKLDKDAKTILNRAKVQKKAELSLPFEIIFQFILLHDHSFCDLIS